MSKTLVVGYRWWTYCKCKLLWAQRCCSVSKQVGKTITWMCHDLCSGLMICCFPQSTSQLRARELCCLSAQNWYMASSLHNFGLHFWMEWWQFKWKSFSKVFSTLYGYIHHSSVMVSHAMLPEVTYVQQLFSHGFQALIFFPWFSESFHNFMYCRWWKTLNLLPLVRCCKATSPCLIIIYLFIFCISP